MSISADIQSSLLSNEAKRVIQAVVDSITGSSGSAGPGTFTALSADTLSTSKTVSTAALGSVRSVHGQSTANFAGTLTSGNLVGVRGVTTIASGTTAGSGSFIYGAQGKVVVASGGVLDGADVAGVVAQLDLSAGTNTSGLVSALWADLGATATGTMSQTHLLRVTNTTAATINGFATLYGKANYFLTAEANGSTWCSATGTPGAVTGATGWIKVLVEGQVRYIALASSVS